MQARRSPAAITQSFSVATYLGYNVKSLLKGRALYQHMLDSSYL